MTTRPYVEYRFALPGLRERRLELGLSLQAVATAIDYDFSSLASIERGKHRCPPELRRRLADFLELPETELFEATPTPPRGQAAHIRAREELMAKVGGCGSPTCQDPACSLVKGSCHRPGCPHPATLAAVTSTTARRVKGEPGLFCSHKCRLEAPTARTGLIAASELAKDVDRARRTVTRYGRKLVVDRVLGQQLPGFRGRSGGLWFFTEEEAEKIRHHMATAPRTRIHNDPLLRAEWYAATVRGEKGTAMYGRKAKELATAKGKKVGRRSTADAARVRELAAEGKSQRQISYMLGLSRGSVQYILRQEVD
jgi:DNA-binding XRE family transcriptional regulator